MVFGERGYSAATLKMIAEQAGLSVTAIYYYFRSIEDLHHAVVAETVRALESCKREVFAQPTLRSQLRAYIFAMHRLDYEDRSVMAFVIRAQLDAVRSPGLFGERGSMMKCSEQLFFAVVRSAVERGELPRNTDVRMTVGLLSSIMWGVGMYSGFVEDADTMAAISHRVDDVIVNGLLKDELPERTNAATCLAG